MADTSQLKKALEDNFGEMDSNKLWTLVKLCKHVRLRARNNSAFNNLFNSLFPNATFRTVTKTRNNYKTGKIEDYPGLSIVVNGIENNQEEGEE